MAHAWTVQKRRWMRRALPEPPKWLPTVPEIMADWLETLPWDWYGTFTFPVWIHPDQAQQRYVTWSAALAQETGFQMQHARALEWQRRDVVHFHALIWGVKRSTSKNRWAENWREIGGGWALLRNYDREQRATYYLGKYVTKGGEVDHLHFGRELPRPDDVRIVRSPSA